MSEKYILMPESLTAENGAKYLMSGEFSVDVEYADNDGDTFCESITIPWTTIKEIYAMAVKELSKPESALNKQE